MAQEDPEKRILAEEEWERVRIDRQGNTWKKVYFGSGQHLKNWLDQTIELFGQDNVKMEEVTSSGSGCSGGGSEKLYRVWVKEVKSSDMPPLPK